MNGEKQIARSIRANSEIFNALKNITVDMNFSSQGETLAALIALWEREQARKSLPEMQSMIDEFDMHLNSLSRLFNELLERSLQQKNVTREKVRAEMDRLRAELNELKQQV